MRQTIILSLVILMAACQKEVTTKSVNASPATNDAAVATTETTKYDFSDEDYICTGEWVHIKGTAFITAHFTTLPIRGTDYQFQTFDFHETGTATGERTGETSNFNFHHNVSLRSTWSDELNGWKFYAYNMNIGIVYTPAGGGPVTLILNNYHILISPDGTIKVIQAKFSFECK